jgi:hypothetical protein
MQNSPAHGQTAVPPRRRNLRRALLLALAAYGLFGVWRTFPRFDSRLIGAWNQTGLRGAPATLSFGQRGSGWRGNDAESRTFRWWTCGNKLLMHEDRGSKRANIGAAMEYAVRTLLFLSPPPDVTEFTIRRLDIYGAQFLKRPEISDGGVTQSLELRR